MWTLHQRQQQRGVQFRPQPGFAPEVISPEQHAPPHHAVVPVKEEAASKPETTDPADLPLPEGK